MAASATVEFGEVSSQPLTTSGIDEWDFEALVKEGIAAHGTNIRIEVGHNEPGFSMANQDRISEFDETTERGREELRSENEAQVDGDNHMRHKSPVAPESSPLSVAAANDQVIDKPGEIEKIAPITAPEDDQVPMTVEEHYPPANGIGEQVSESSAETGGQAVTVTDPQTVHNTDAATAKAPGEGGAKSPISPPESDVDQEMPQPKLVDEIIKAVASPERKQFKKGDVAIILDPAALCKFLLISSDRLEHASSILSAVALDEKVDSKATSVVSQIFVLEPADPTPLLRALEAGVTLAKFEADCISSDVAPATDPSDRVKIKREEGIERVEQPSELSANWFVAYTTLFEVIDASRLGATKRQLFGTDATDVHPHFVAVMTIAKHYSALPALDLALLRSMNTWIRNCSLYAAIKDDPVSWLEIAITMKNTDINEAFVHCAGALVGCPHALETLRPDVTATMERKAAELTERRKEVDPRLSNLMLTTEVPLGAGYRAKAYVSIKDDPVAWIVNQLFADWMREHISYLKGLDEEAAHEGGEFEPEETLVNVKTMATCDHMGKQCLTVGGFYRVLGKADESYLPVSKVLELLADWNKKFACDAVKAGVRDALQKLKIMTKAIVGSLADSHLTYADVEELDYLTCVEVKEGDVPWEDEDVKMED